MEKIINKKRYSTETAEFVGCFDNGCSWSDFDYYGETLYRKRSGEFFLHLAGGANSRLAVCCGSNSWSGSQKIVPVSYDEAQQWAEKNLDAETFEKYFEVCSDDDELHAMTVRISSEAYSKLQQEISKSGKTCKQIISELLVNSL